MEEPLSTGSRLPFASIAGRFRSRSSAGPSAPASTGPHNGSRPSYLRRPRFQPRAEALVPFQIEPALAQRFNAYAAAAFPREIGGLLRIIEDEGVYRAVDMKIFPHLAASAAYFELDGEEIARFLTELVLQKRKEEIGEWRGLVHSHPNMQPFMSGPDRENLLRLAGKKWAFSLICSAHPKPEYNYFAVHYAQTTPWPLVVDDLAVRSSEPGRTLAGVELLSSEEIEDVALDVKAVLGNAHGYGGFRSGGSLSWQSSVGLEPADGVEAFADEEAHFDVPFSRGELDLVEEALDAAGDDPERLGTTPALLRGLRRRIEDEALLSCLDLQLLSALLDDYADGLYLAGDNPGDPDLQAAEQLLRRVERRLEAADDSFPDEDEDRSGDGASDGPGRCWR